MKAATFYADSAQQSLGDRINLSAEALHAAAQGFIRLDPALNAFLAMHEANVNLSAEALGSKHPASLLYDASDGLLMAEEIRTLAPKPSDRYWLVCTSLAPCTYELRREASQNGASSASAPVPATDTELPITFDTNDLVLLGEELRRTTTFGRFKAAQRNSVW